MEIKANSSAPRQRGTIRVVKISLVVKRETHRFTLPPYLCCPHDGLVR